MLRIKPIISTNIYSATVLRILLMLAIFQLSRLGFYLFNDEFFPKVTFDSYLKLAYGGFVFDLSAVLYTNILYIFMMLVPTLYRYNTIYQRIAKCLFFVTNISVLIANTMDYTYYPYTFRRTTALVFEEFQNETNILSVILQTEGKYWYVTLIILIAIMVYGYNAVRIKRVLQIRPALYYPITTMFFMMGVGLFVGGVRGGFQANRPISVNNAIEYATNFGEEAIVLNTPFSIFRTFGEEMLREFSFFNKEELDHIQSNIHQTIQNEDSITIKKNVVIIIMESFGKEYVGVLNRNENIDNYKGYTPFLDSIVTESLYFTNAFANGRRSVEAMASILSSIPSFTRPFVLSSYLKNDYNSINTYLGQDGYNSMFYHGAPNGSMGFYSFAKKIGVEHYVGKNEYNNDSDFDGVWGIWDEPFLKFAAKDISKYSQPFVATIFTLSSHHPFKVPTQYEGVFDKGNLPIHQTIGYSDNALREFFEIAKTQDWYDNTLFVITADHTSLSYYEKYKTTQGIYSIPIIFFTPSKELKGKREENVQQIDIMPTVLDYLKYDKPFFSFGKSVLTPTEDSDFAIFYHNNNYVALYKNYLLIFDGTKSLALYDYRNDWSLTTNVLEQETENAKIIRRKTKAFLQSYNNALIHNEMTQDPTAN